MSKASRNRDRLIKEYGKLYKRLENCDLGKCWYCDDRRQTLDHCPPIAQLENIDIDRFVKSGGELCLVPSCNECNSILGAKALFTPQERIVHLHEAYAKKIDKFFSDWTPDEIAELGPNMRREVLAKQRIVNEWIAKSRNIETNIINLPD